MARKCLGVFETIKMSLFIWTHEFCWGGVSVVADEGIVEDTFTRFGVERGEKNGFDYLSYMN